MINKDIYRKPNKAIISHVLLYLLLIIHLGMIIFPIYIMVLTSFKSNAEIFKEPLGLPKSFNLDNIAKLITQHNYFIYYRNSLFVSIVSIIILLMVTSLASYALAKYEFRFNKLIYFFFLSGFMIPIRLGTINIFQNLYRIGLYNNLFGLILVYTTMGIPMGIFVLTDFIKTIPEELSHAARIDGCSEFSIFYKIIIPLSRPALVTVSIYNFIPIWNDFWWPLILIKSDSLKTVPLATTLFYGEYLTQWGLVFSALSLASIPVIIFYLILSKQFIRGLTSGAIKG